MFSDVKSFPQGYAMVNQPASHPDIFFLLHRMAGRCRESLRKESLPNGDLCSESDADSTSRKLSLLKIVGRGKKRESLVDRSASPGPEEEPVEEVPVVKPREPLSGKQRWCF